MTDRSIGRPDVGRRNVLKAAAGTALGAVAGATPAARVEAQNAAAGTRALALPLRPADLVLTNGKIITVDRAFTITDSIAVAGNRIVAVGPREAMAQFTAPATRVVDLKGKAVMPGLVDGHAHMDREGLKSIFPALGPVRSIRDIQDRIAELARSRAPGEWIVTMPIGDPPFYFDVPDTLAEKRWPTRQELDAAAPNNPVFIRSRRSPHSRSRRTGTATRPASSSRTACSRPRS
jgi:Amidohydrolase family